MFFGAAAICLEMSHRFMENYTFSHRPTLYLLRIKGVGGWSEAILRPRSIRIHIDINPERLIRTGSVHLKLELD